MTDANVAAQIRSIELQLAVLKARVGIPAAHPAIHCLGDLYGLLAGSGDFSEEDIDRAQYTSSEEPCVRESDAR
jgi:hypothetical protein